MSVSKKTTWGAFKNTDSWLYSSDLDSSCLSQVLGICLSASIPADSDAGGAAGVI